MAHEVFLSHSSHDKAVADAVCARLESSGVRCWVAPRDVLPGEQWGEAIVNAIRGSRAMVVILSSDANGSPQILREVERAVSNDLIVIPFRIEEVAPSPALEYYISSPHWLDAITEPLERHIERLARTLQQVLNKPIDQEQSCPTRRVVHDDEAVSVGQRLTAAIAYLVPPVTSAAVWRISRDTWVRRHALQSAFAGAALVSVGFMVRHTSDLLTDAGRSEEAIEAALAPLVYFGSLTFLLWSASLVSAIAGYRGSFPLPRACTKIFERFAEATPVNRADRWMAFFALVLPPLSSIAMYPWSGRRPFARLHGLQGIMHGVFGLALYVAIGLLARTNTNIFADALPILVVMVLFHAPWFLMLMSVLTGTSWVYPPYRPVVGRFF